jgi:hypothetical protein
MRIAPIIILLAASFLASADTIYTSQSAWNAAVPGETTLNFAGIATPLEIVSYGTGVGATTTLGGVTYTIASPTNSGDYLGIIGSSYPGVEFGVPTLAVAGDPPGPATLLLTLPAPVDALGFVFDTDESADVTITLSDGTVETEPSRYPNLDFFGVTSTTGITSVEISDSLYPSGEQAIFLSQFAFGPSSAAAVPEPRTLGLLLAAILALGLSIRRKPALRAKP